MDKAKNLLPTSKTLLAASGIVCGAVSAYVIYKLVKKDYEKPDETYPDPSVSITLTAATPTTSSSDRQLGGTEHTDFSDWPETQVSESGTKVLVLGLEKAGKSCLLAALSSEEETKAYEPTQGFNVICMSTQSAPRLDIMEVGGSEKYKEYWEYFVKDICILMYVVDSSDEAKIPEASDALFHVLQMRQLENVPVIIVFTKSDDEHALSFENMKMHFEVDRFRNRSFQYSSVQVRSGGAPITKGVQELNETIQSLQ
eukprot:gene5378-6052_t